jgi:hypothetical protein
MLFKRNLPLLPYLRAYKVFPEPVRRSYLRAYKAPFYVSFCTFCASLRPKRTVFTRLQIKVRPKGLHSFAFYILIFAFSLTSYGIISTKEQVRKNKLFLQNKAKSQKVKFDVTKVLTKDYDQMDTWSIRITKPIKANKSQLKPIKANLSCRQTQKGQIKRNFYYNSGL